MNFEFKPYVCNMTLVTADMGKYKAFVHGMYLGIVSTGKDTFEQLEILYMIWHQADQEGFKIRISDVVRAWEDRALLA